MQTTRDHVPSAARPFPSRSLVPTLDTGYKIEHEDVSPVEPTRLPSDASWASQVLCARSKAKSLFLRILREIGGRGPLARLAGFAVLMLSLSAVASAQGILTVTPTRTAATTAGTGAVGYTGDGSPAAAATLANPSAVAYDAAGDLFLADANNHVVREVSAAGVITTVAGTGVEGYSGDGGAATSAQLDTPTGVAVDSSGNIFIADSHNHRIREVSGGNIATIAGTGVAGFSGDGSTAKAAQLSLPSGVAVDTTGNVYIADTNNHRIRKISGGNISTIAGDGEELFAGDGGTATAAALDSPTGVAVDASGNVYIADRLNQRVREVSGGNISTIAGSGSASFSGSFAGDGANATAASLARPSGVSVDASGNVYIADSDNQRVRQVSSTGTIGTISGSGAQGFSGDSGAATAAILNSPRAVATDASGNLSIADRQNQRIRAGLLPTLTFANDGVGIASTGQSVTLANTGSATITVSTLTFAGPFTTTSGGNCGSTPIMLGVGASCTQNVAFLPVATGAASGSVIFGGAGVVPQKILLAGTGVQASSTTTLSSSLATPLAGQAVTFTATVKPAGLGTATGSVTFYDGTASLGTIQLSGGSAMLTTAALPDGTNSITAVYSSDPNFTGSTSNVLPQLVEDFQLAVSGVTVLSVVPGTSATFGGFVSSTTGAFTYPVVLSIAGLPAGAIATFNPASVTLGTAPVPVTVTIQTAAVARMHYPGFFVGSSTALALLILPFGRRFRRRIPKVRIWLSLLMLLGLGSLAGLAGCGTGSGLFGQQQQTYTVSLVGTATGANGATLQRSISYTLTVQ